MSSWAIRELSFEVLAPIVHQCLLRIQEADEGSDFGLPERFEPARGVAARHRLGSKLAGLLKVETFLHTRVVGISVADFGLGRRSLGTQATAGTTTSCTRTRRRREASCRGWWGSCRARSQRKS